MRAITFKSGTYSFRARLPVGLALFWGLLGGSALRADVLVLRDGSRVETKGPFEVRGRQVIFTDSQGQLSALRLSEVDFEASKRATSAPPVVEREPVAAAEESKPVLTLTNRSLAKARARKIAVPGHGELIFEAPTDWVFELQQPAGDLPPTLYFVSKSGAIKFLVTVMWSVSGDAAFNSPTAVERLTQDVAVLLRAQSIRVPTPEPMPGVRGFWVWANDPAPKKGEFAYVAQGNVAVGPLLLVFSWLTHMEPPDGMEELFSFFSHTRHVPD